MTEPHFPEAIANADASGQAPQPLQFMAHKGGLMAMVLTGDERRKAHQRIAAMLSKGGDMAGEQLLSLARLDPTLFLEPGAPRDFGGWGRSESGSIKTWLTVATVAHATQTIAHLFDAGVRPDDEEAFSGRTFFGYSVWMTSPELTAQALRAGANPNITTRKAHLVVRPNDRIPLRRIVNEIARMIQYRMSDNSMSRVAWMIESAQQLLDNGAAYRDPCPTIVDGDRFHRNAISALTSVWNIQHGPWLRTQLRPLMQKLVDKGASLNDSFAGIPGEPSDPPLIHALRSGNIHGACLLIELGANTDDAFLAQAIDSNNPAGAMNLLDWTQAIAEQDKADSNRAKLLEALLKRRLQMSPATVQEPAPETGSAPQQVPTRRRAMRV